MINMTELKVCKFGGSSLASSAQIKKAAEIIKADKTRRIIVVSSPKGVTDSLIASCKLFIKTQEFPKESFDKIKSIFEEIGRGLDLSKMTSEALVDLKERISAKVENPDEYCDNVKSWGEYSTALIISAYINKMGSKSIFMCPKGAGFYVTEDFGNAKVIEETYDNLKKTLNNISEVILFPGFYGRTKNGKRATMSRGGSDLTGSVIASALKANMYENWTDQDGIKSADPRIVKNASQIKFITYKEIRELSYRGFKVFHAEAMIPAMRNRIPINIRNTNNPEDKGTYIISHREQNGSPIIGIAAKNEFAIFNIEKVLMDNEVGFGRRLLGIFENYGLSYEHSPSGIDSISVILDQTQLNKDMIKKIIQDIKSKLAPESVSIEKDKCLISVVGAGLKRTPGIASRITRSLADANVNIEILNQGASEISLIIGIDQKDSIKSVNAIYKEFFR